MKEPFIIILVIYILDLLRNAYQAIVAQNNYTSRAIRYKDKLVDIKKRGDDEEDSESLACERVTR